jgi:hypothetical protein
LGDSRGISLSPSEPEGIAYFYDTHKLTIFQQFPHPAPVADHLPGSRLIGGVGKIPDTILIGKVFSVLISFQS